MLYLTLYPYTFFQVVFKLYFLFYIVQDKNGQMLRVKMEQVKLHISYFCKIMNIYQIKTKKQFYRDDHIFLESNQLPRQRQNINILPQKLLAAKAHFAGLLSKILLLQRNSNETKEANINALTIVPRNYVHWKFHEFSYDNLQTSMLVVSQIYKILGNANWSYKKIQ